LAQRIRLALRVEQFEDWRKRVSMRVVQALHQRRLQRLPAAVPTRRPPLLVGGLHADHEVCEMNRGQFFRDPAALTESTGMDADELAALAARWTDVERAALAPLGLRPGAPETYTVDLGQAGVWQGRVVLPKEYDPESRPYVRQAWPGASLIHRPTEDLVREWRGYRPGEGPDGLTVGLHEMYVDQAREGTYPAGGQIDVRTPEDIPAAVAQTVRLVREVLLPTLAEWADTTRVRRYLVSAGAVAGLARDRLAHRMALAYLAGDLDEVRQLREEYRGIAGTTGIPDIDDVDRRLLAALDRAAG
jgi:hypothetical protein